MAFRETASPNCGVDDARQLNQLIAYHGCRTAEYSINLYKAWKAAAVGNVSPETSPTQFLIYLLLAILILSISLKV